MDAYNIISFCGIFVMAGVGSIGFVFSEWPGLQISGENEMTPDKKKKEKTTQENRSREPLFVNGRGIFIGRN